MRILHHKQRSGPCLIKFTTYYLDGAPVEFKELLNVVEKLPSEFGVYVARLKPGSAISKDEKCSIVEIKWDSLKYELPENKETRKRVADDVYGFARQLSKRLGVIVEWESSYGEKGKIQSHPDKA